MAHKLLSESELAESLQGLAWDRDGGELVREVTLADFNAAVEFVNKVAKLAEEMNHHPDINIAYRRVTLRVSTHSAGGLTELDVELARKVDALVAATAG